MSPEAFVLKVEQAHFRTADDTGANPAVMMIWNMVRGHFHMKELKIEDLPAFCVTHGKYHKIEPEYGCIRKNQDRALCPLPIPERGPAQCADGHWLGSPEHPVS